MLMPLTAKPMFAAEFQGVEPLCANLSEGGKMDLLYEQLGAKIFFIEGGGIAHPLS